MRKTLFRLSMIAFALLGMQSTLTAQEKTPLNQVVNTLKEKNQSGRLCTTGLYIRRCRRSRQYIRHQTDHLYGTW